MVDKGLLNYVRQQLKAGYSPEQINAVLLRSGYAQSTAEQAIREAQRPAKHIMPILAAALIIIIALIFVFIYLGEPEEIPALLAVNARTRASSVNAGEMLPFSISIANSGSQKSVELEIVYQAVSADNKTISTKQEYKTMQGSGIEIMSEIEIPKSADAGAYTFKATVYYGTKQASSSAVFDVKKAETPIDITTEPVQLIDVVELRCPESCDDNDKCTTDYCSSQTYYICQNTPIVPCCGNRRCDYGEDYLNCPSDCFAPRQESEFAAFVDVAEEVRRKAQQSTQAAVDFCQSQKAEDDINTCYYSLAGALQQSGPCDNIISEVQKDNCYTEYGVLLDDYSVCLKLANRYLKQSCEQLQQLKQGQ